jgi:transglutaminase-like putative cysteine protease
MRIRISHDTHYRYEQPPTGVIQMLRLTPRHHEGQYVVRWRIDLSQDCRLDQREDALGNVVHAFTAAGPFSEITLHVEGEVDTQDTAGVVRGTIERFPPSVFLRDTALTEPDAGIAAFARDIAAHEREPLDRLHALTVALHREIAFDPDPTHVHTTATQAFALKRGVCQDLTHIFIAAARSLEMPCRYVSGHLKRSDQVVEQDAGHAWAEAFVPDLGWVGFDPTNGVSVTEAHVRVAIGFDYLGAAPVRGSRHGGGGETLEVAIRVETQAQAQAQA